MRSPYYWTCPYCGANLDPGEKCDCPESLGDIKKLPPGRRPQRQQRTNDARTHTLILYPTEGDMSSASMDRGRDSGYARGGR